MKKNRDNFRLFFVEGAKSIGDFIASGMFPETLIGNETTVKGIKFPQKCERFSASLADLQKMSGLKTSTDVFALFKIPEHELLLPELTDNLTIYCDAVQNPGNLGTIIRTADWFGIRNIVCSPDTVDVYNPKVVQATMGSLARVKIHYAEPNVFFEAVKSINLPVYGAFMDGENIYENTVSANGILVLGNEGQGIGASVEKYISQRISIPRFGKSGKPESLNVAVAGSILMSEFMRRNS